jgi:hypothetical protein
MRAWAMLGVLLTSAPTAKALMTSPCLGLKRPSVKFATLHAGTVGWKETGATSTIDEPDEPVVVCLPAAAAKGGRQPVIAVGGGVAMLGYVDPGSLVEVKLDEAGWKRFRFGEGNDGQTGCLKKFPAGTVLFDGPAGEPVGVIADKNAPFGKWDEAENGGSTWAQLHVGVGFGPQKVWLKDRPGDWCPK